MKRARVLASGLLMAGALASCGAPAPGPVTLSLESTSWTVVPWKADGSHQVKVRGEVVQARGPASAVQVGNRKADLGSDGSFSVLVDRSFPHAIPVKVVGSSPGPETDLLVYFPVSLTKVEEQGTDVVVTGRVDLDQSEPYRLDTWSLEGSVRRADGQPADHAVVSIAEYGVSSTPGLHVENFRGATTDAGGRFRFFYSADDDLQVTLRVAYRGVNYQIPERRVYELPSETSSRIDIVLPATGATIIDRPPTLVGRQVPGARWKVLVVSAASGAGNRYPSTVVGPEGRFQVRIPKAEVAGAVWFEQYYEVYQESPLTAGQWLNADAEAVADGERAIVPSSLIQRDPQTAVAALP